MKKFRGGFFMAFMLALWMSVGFGIGILYEIKARAQGSLGHYALQLRLYDQAIPHILRACIRKYSIPSCLQMEFSLQNYFFSLKLIAQNQDFYLLDSNVRTQDALSGQILQKTSRRVVRIFGEDFAWSNKARPQQ